VHQTAAGPIHPPDADKTGSSRQGRAADSHQSELVIYELVGRQHCQEPAYAIMTFSSLKIHANKLAGESFWGISDAVWRRRITERNKFGLSRAR
jgi:hypothetical protein